MRNPCFTIHRSFLSLRLIIPCHASFVFGYSAQDAIYRVPAIPAAGLKVIATAYTESGGGMAANA